MDPIARMVAAGAAGAAGSGPGLYVDDVFSTYLYYGTTDPSLTITNGIDLSGEGGLVWIKQRNGQRYHHLFDTERGATKYLHTRNAATEATNAETLTSFTSSGFTLGDDTQVNHPEDFVSWTFRKAPGFFDVVTYAGTGSAHSISHSLGSVPGMIIYKAIDDSREWMVYHRSLGASQGLILNETYAAFSTSDFGSGPTSTHFSVGNTAVNNTSGKNYIAYIFAHDDQSFGTNSDEAIIKCGSYTGDGSESGNVIDLGFEPQWLMIKRTSNTDSWLIWDTMRGMANGVQDPYLEPNTSDAEDTFAGVNVLPTGFELASSTGFQNSSGENYIYMAIRRPHKPPTAGTDVFAANVQTSPTYAKTFTTGFPVDLAILYDRTTSRDKYWFDRLRGPDVFGLESTTNHAETSYTGCEFDRQTTWKELVGFGTTSASGVLLHAFRRAPGVFDIVAAAYPSSSAAIPHNLGVAPELIINKPRDVGISWMVGSDYLPNTNGWNRYIEISSPGGESATTTVWDQTAPTATHFTLGSYPGSSYKGIFYLFATLDGISKVGSYSGTGSNVNVDCGFTAGARFVLIKRTDSSGDWYVWDSTRGIVSGNDPYLLLNSTAAEVTNTDYIDPLNAGFTVTSSAPAALNTSGGTYLFLAIA